MAKKVAGYIKLQVPAGQANPSPPVGPALGQHGVNIMEFCKAFNAQTQGLEPGMPTPTVITVYNDRSFTFVTKTPPASVLLRQAGREAAFAEAMIHRARRRRRRLRSHPRPTPEASPGRIARRCCCSWSRARNQSGRQTRSAAVVPDDLAGIRASCWRTRDSS